MPGLERNDAHENESFDATKRVNKSRKPKSASERLILEKQQKLALMLTSDKNKIIDNTLATTQKPSDTTSSAKQNSKQQELLQKSKQKKILTAMFSASGNQIQNDGNKRSNDHFASICKNSNKTKISNNNFEHLSKKQKTDETLLSKKKYEPSMVIASSVSTPNDAIAQARIRQHKQKGDDKTLVGKGKNSQFKRAIVRGKAAGSTSTPTTSSSNNSSGKIIEQKYYPKIENDDFWKNLRSWDILKDLNAYAKSQKSSVTDSKRKENTTKPTVSQNARGYNIKPNSDNITQTTGKEEKIVITSEKENQKKVSSSSKEMQSIPDKFTSARQYKALWAPMCLEETRAQVLSEIFSSSSDSFNKSVFDVRNIDRSALPVSIKPVFNDVGSTSDSLSLQLHPSKKYSFAFKDKSSFICNDLVLLVKDIHFVKLAMEGRFTNKSDKNCTSRKEILVNGENEDFKNIKGVVAHVDTSRKSVDGLIIKVSRNLWPVAGSTEMFLLRIGSYITSLREFTALCNVDNIPLLQELLSSNLGKEDNSADGLSEKTKAPAMFGTKSSSSELGKGFMKYAIQKFNSSQLEAISTASSEYGKGGFTLVKGPPGTGKTTTLVAILNSLHIRQFNRYYEEVRRIVSKTNYTDLKALKEVIQEAARSKPRILVCAPSNIAVDNIILKIMETGFLDGNGKMYKPHIVRVGVGQSSAVKDVALEAQVDRVMADGENLMKLQGTIAEYKKEQHRLRTNYVKLRQRIQALNLASPWPLEAAWEIRIDEKTFDETGRVYFVNHKTKSTTFDIPQAAEPGVKTFAPSSMPEHILFTNKIVKTFENYHAVTSKIEQLELVQGIAAVASNGGGTGRDASQDIVNVKQQIQTLILDYVHIVLTTLGTAGSSTLESLEKFEVVVIDEAAQSVEPQTLSALQLGSSHAVLVGDPQQLPATIFSVSGKDSKYDRSLFQRLEESGHSVHMLDTQYRMNPGISEFPRTIFYNELLKDGPNVKHSDFGGILRKNILYNIPSFQPFTLLDLDSSEERGGTSLANVSEAQLAIHLLSTLDKASQGESLKCKIAIISPYKEQVNVLRRSIENFFGQKRSSRLEVNTVDSYQGKEADIVIFSCVRASDNKSIGFLSDVRRMNVALTRAKYFLFVIARCKSIIVNHYWRQLVSHAHQKEAIIQVPYQSVTQGKPSSRNDSSLTFEFYYKGLGRNSSGIMFPSLLSLKANSSMKIRPSKAAAMNQNEKLNVENEEGEMSDFSA